MTTNPPSAVSSPGSEVSTSDSNGPDGKPNGKSSSTHSTGLSLLSDFPLPDAMSTYVTFAQRQRTESLASQGDSHARIFPTPEPAEKQGASVSPGAAAACSLRQCALSPKYNLNGWSSKTSKLYAFPTKGEISPPSSGRFATAGMWDSGGLWMRDISEAPADVAVSSWSQVLATPPRWSFFLTPLQWRQYLARCLRSNSFGQRTHGLGILYRPRTTGAEPLWALNFSWLKRTDGIRWLSGSECLEIMGFGSDWMSSALRKSSVPEMPLTLVSRGGLRKN